MSKLSKILASLLFSVGLITGCGGGSAGPAVTPQPIQSITSDITGSETAGGIEANLASAFALPEGPAAEAFHLLPPLGDSGPRSENFDASLLEHLKISICEPVGIEPPTEAEVVEIVGGIEATLEAEVQLGSRSALLEAVNQETCLTVHVATSGGAAPGLGFITLQENRYYMQWHARKSDVGKELWIWFEVAALPVALVQFTPSAPRMYPIKFHIDDHPLLRTRALHAEGLTATEVAHGLIAEFGLSAEQIAGLLLEDDALFPTLQIGRALRDVWGYSAADAILLLLEHYSAVRITEVLVEVYEATDPAHVAEMLDFAGVAPSDIYLALRQNFDLSSIELTVLMAGLGLRAIELSGAGAATIAARFAPQLRFDTDANCTKGSWYGAETQCSYPMSAQVYYNTIIASGITNLSSSGLGDMGYSDPWEHPLLHNPDETTLASGTLPTYYRVFKSVRSEQVRIVYWWFYGWQNQCLDVDPHSALSGGHHHGDWEHVVVITNEAQSHVGAVKFAQHGTWYTRVRAQSSSTPFQLVNGEHPVVYVGKQQHGSYYNDGGTGTCLLLEDWRNNGTNQAFRMETEAKLVSLSDADQGEPWMVADRNGGFMWGWNAGEQWDVGGVSTHPTTSEKGAQDGFRACAPDAFGECLPTMATVSQCMAGDLDFFGCWHCKAGYTNAGTACYKFWGPFPTSSHSLDFYWYDYWVPWTDAGLLYKVPGRVGSEGVGN